MEKHRFPASSERLNQPFILLQPGVFLKSSAEKALRRLDGVDKVSVSLRDGKAITTPKVGESFDPFEITKAIKKAGFTPGEVDLTVQGKLSRYKEFWALEVPGLAQPLLLSRGPASGKLGKSTAPKGRMLTVTGQLHPSHGDEPPGMTVEKFTSQP